MPFQSKAHLPRDLKIKVNVYRLLRKNLDGINLSESQVLGLMAYDADFDRKVAALKREATRTLNGKQLTDIKKQIEFTRKKYGIQ